MNMKTYERRSRNFSIALYACAVALAIFAAYLQFELGMWLKALFVALWGIAFFMLAFSLKLEWDAGGRLFFWLFFICIALTLAVAGYWLHSMIP